MKIRLLYFARLREQLGAEGETLSLSPATVGDAVTVADVLTALRARGGIWAETLAEDRALAFAVGQTFADKNATVNEGEEVAIFPPVTGG